MSASGGADVVFRTGMDDRIGSLQVGKLADLIVLDTNIFEIDPHEIHSATVILTMMNGKIRRASRLR